MIKHPTASRFKAWRSRLGLEREQAADLLSTSKHTIKAYELGDRRVPDQVFKLMEMLESSLPPAPPPVPGAPIRIVGGGTVSHIRNHLALCAPAYGTTTKRLLALVQAQGRDADLILTRMADAKSRFETNDDLAQLADEIVADKTARIVFWNPALCDYDGQIGEVPSDRKADRLKTKDGELDVHLRPADKVINRFRATRKDLFLVAFKTTTNATREEQYRAGLSLLKRASVNLVLANDTVTGLNMVIVPEEARYHETFDREAALTGLVDMALLRATNTFTRTEVVSEEGVPWDDPMIGDNLRQVVGHCIERGAYKPFEGKTVGHFATRGPEDTIITSRRKSNFNYLAMTGMVRLAPVGDSAMLAYGGKPSVGGMSQKIIFENHPDVDNIVHFHCPLKPGAFKVPRRPQRQNECGSHQCGKNTSDGLVMLEDGIKVVMLENHGPNICFSKDVPAERVIDFVERHFDLEQKTGGMV